MAKKKKTSKTGRVLYVPNPIVQEIEEYRTRNNKSLRESWQKMQEHIEVGKEMERIGNIFGLRRRK